MRNLNKRFYFSCFFVLSVITVLPLFNFYIFFENHFLNTFKTQSSVWCVKGLGGENLCKFKNVYYDPHKRALLFFLSKETIIKGLKHYSDLQKIQLSSINLSNQFHANISVIHINDYEFGKKIKVEKKAFLISRFKSDNAMHVIHDDLFPYFLTLEYLCSNDKNCMESYTLIIHDNYKSGPFFDLYKLFSKKNPIILNQLPTHGDHVLCFEEMSTGLVQDGAFYQYGFNKPHGPVDNPLLSGSDLSRFTSFIKDKLGPIDEDPGRKSSVLIISRKRTRKILNVDRVVKMVESAYRKSNGKKDVEITVKDLLTTEIDYFIRLILNCDLLIGMHGGEMIFAIFAKPESTIVELFPFGIQPEIVSFLRPISRLDGIRMNYFSWKNANENNSVSHPEAHPLLGGINHLGEEIKEKIEKIKLVPAVECCNDPTYLYRMYQDTNVGLELEDFLTDSISKSSSADRVQSSSVEILEKWFHPSHFLDVRCEFRLRKRILFAVWNPPFNVKDPTRLEYSVHVKGEREKFGREWRITNSSNLIVRFDAGKLEICPDFHLWIFALYAPNGSKSRDTHLKCPCV